MHSSSQPLQQMWAADEQQPGAVHSTPPDAGAPPAAGGATATATASTSAAAAAELEQLRVALGEERRRTERVLAEAHEAVEAASTHGERLRVVEHENAQLRSEIEQLSHRARPESTTTKPAPPADEPSSVAGGGGGGGGAGVSAQSSPSAPSPSAFSPSAPSPSAPSPTQLDLEVARLRGALADADAARASAAAQAATELTMAQQQGVQLSAERDGLRATVDGLRSERDAMQRALAEKDVAVASATATVEALRRTLADKEAALVSATADGAALRRVSADKEAMGAAADGLRRARPCLGIR